MGQDSSATSVYDTSAWRHTSKVEVQSCSLACPIPKCNGKSGCLASRLISIPDMFGKKWYKGLWHPPNCWSENAYGYIPQRRREGAVLQQRAAQWWLVRQHLGWCCSSYDISNAFPSMTKVRLPKVVGEVVEP